MSILGNTILDHRHKQCEPYPLRGRMLDFLPHTSLPSDVARAIRTDIRAARPAIPRRVRFKVAVMIVVFVLNTAFILSNPAVRGPGRWPFLAFGLLLIAGFAGGVFYRVADPTEIVRSFVAHRRCPSCAYDLSATEPSPDGRTVCSECGAAWDISAQRPA